MPEAPEDLDPSGSAVSRRAVSRRTLLRGAGTGLLALGGSQLLAACGGGSGSSPSSGANSAAIESQGTPVKGGTLRLGASGGGTGDTLEAQNLVTNADFARAYALYEGLTTVSNGGEVVNVLAESLEPNADATEWTIRVRPGVLAHDGKPFGARDVLFSLQRIVSQKLPGLSALGPIEISGATVLDAQTLRVPFSTPYGILPDQLAYNTTFMVPVGFNPKTNPIGTGPFKYQSFTPGQQSTWVRFDEYWDHPRPYLDALEVIDFADETAQVNAFQAGQVDAIDYLSATSVAALKAAGGVAIVSKTGAWEPFTMRVDRAPFNDVRVRTALKLSVNRSQMLEQVFGGYGTVGNDVWGIYDPDFYHGLPQRVQDIEQAKSLLKSAGQSSPQAVLVTTPAAPGMVQAAQVLATQASASGFQIKLQQQQPTPYYAQSYLKVTFSQDYLPFLPYLVDAGYTTVAGASYNSTHFSDPTYNGYYKRAIETTDNTVRREMIQQMLEVDYHEGGYCIPFFYPVIDGVTDKVRGITPSVTGLALGGFDYKNIWMAA
jgi:peptide/nickel transport system substrate-binding protein